MIIGMSYKSPDPLERIDRGARISANCTHRVPEENLVAALRDVARLYGKCTSPNYVEAYEMGLVSPSPRTFLVRFGSWNAALEAAELRVVRRRPAYKNRLSDEDLIAGPRACASEIGHIPSLVEYRAWRDSRHPCDAIIRTRLGGWSGVLKILHEGTTSLEPAQ